MKAIEQYFPNSTLTRALASSLPFPRLPPVESSYPGLNSSYKRFAAFCKEMYETLTRTE